MAESILVGPANLSFYSSEPTQRFDIYNMNPNTVHYIVQSTGPERYLVSPREGSILSNCKVSMDITHKDICVTNENVRDIIRITFTVIRNKKREVLCYKEVNAVLYSHRKLQSSQIHSGDTLPGHSLSAPASPSMRRSLVARHQQAEAAMSVRQVGLHVHEPPGYHILFYLLPILMGSVALWLPTQESAPDTLWYLQISVPTKITISFFLGMLAVLFYQRIQQAER